MVLMYCYGSSFHANRFRLASSASSSFTTPAAITEKVSRKIASIYLALHNRERIQIFFLAVPEFNDAQNSFHIQQ